ncbi:MAG: HAD family hydrolase [Bacteroidia bacterium]
MLETIDFSEIKLIISDLDGTLLNDNKELSADFFEIEEALFNKGIVFAVASGRQFYNMKNLFAPIAHRLLFIAENGTYVSQHNELIHLETIPMNRCIPLIQKARSLQNAYTIVCAKNAAYIESREEVFVQEVNKYYAKVEIVEDLTLIQDEVLKVTICDFTDPNTNAFPHFKEDMADLNVVVSGIIWLDISIIGANKGKAIRKVQQNWNISENQTMVFGDYLNDLEMMQVADFSFAMKNAHPKILETAKYQTSLTNAEHGVSHILRKIAFAE